LGHAIRESRGTPINASSPQEMLDALAGREGRREWNVHTLCLEGKCGKILVVPAKQRDC
jgi:hypothetical protein